MKKALIFIAALLIIILYRPLVADRSADADENTDKDKSVILAVSDKESNSDQKKKLDSLTTLPATSAGKPKILESHLPSIYLPEPTHTGLRYSLRYAKNNPYSGPSLKNTTVHIMLYKYANPDGFRRVKTDAFQRFSIDETLIPSLAVEIISVDGQNALKLQCYGGSLPGKLDAVIKCQRAR